MFCHKAKGALWRNISATHSRNLFEGLSKLQVNYSSIWAFWRYSLGSPHVNSQRPWRSRGVATGNVTQYWITNIASEGITDAQRILCCYVRVRPFEGGLYKVRNLSGHETTLDSRNLAQNWQRHLFYSILKARGESRMGCQFQSVSASLTDFRVCTDKCRIACPKMPVSEIWIIFFQVTLKRFNSTMFFWD